MQEWPPQDDVSSEEEKEVNNIENENNLESEEVIMWDVVKQLKTLAKEGGNIASATIPFQKNKVIFNEEALETLEAIKAVAIKKESMAKNGNVSEEKISVAELVQNLIEISNERTQEQTEKTKEKNNSEKAEDVEKQIQDVREELNNLNPKEEVNETSESKEAVMWSVVKQVKKLAKEGGEIMPATVPFAKNKIIFNEEALKTLEMLKTIANERQSKTDGGNDVSEVIDQMIRSSLKRSENSS
jgi:hypothetical protein